MSFASLNDPSMLLTSPPPGATNVKNGKPVQGLGGRWIPCATAISDGVFVPGLFQVGPGCRQVCLISREVRCIDKALSLAVSLAKTAAA